MARCAIVVVYIKENELYSPFIWLTGQYIRPTQIVYYFWNFCYYFVSLFDLHLMFWKLIKSFLFFRVLPNAPRVGCDEPLTQINSLSGNKDGSEDDDSNIINTLSRLVITYYSKDNSYKLGAIYNILGHYICVCVVL